MKGNLGTLLKRFSKEIVQLNGLFSLTLDFGLLDLQLFVQCASPH